MQISMDPLSWWEKRLGLILLVTGCERETDKKLKIIDGIKADNLLLSPIKLNKSFVYSVK